MSPPPAPAEFSHRNRPELAYRHLVRKNTESMCNYKEAAEDGFLAPLWSPDETFAARERDWKTYPPFSDMTVDTKGKDLTGIPEDVRLTGERCARLILEGISSLELAQRFQFDFNSSGKVMVNRQHTGPAAQHIDGSIFEFQYYKLTGIGTVGTNQRFTEIDLEGIPRDPQTLKLAGRVDKSATTTKQQINAKQVYIRKNDSEDEPATDKWDPFSIDEIEGDGVEWEKKLSEAIKESLTALRQIEARITLTCNQLKTGPAVNVTFKDAVMEMHEVSNIAKTARGSMKAESKLLSGVYESITDFMKENIGGESDELIAVEKGDDMFNDVHKKGDRVMAD
ncbi:hypothetical protein FGG08_002778 [Glutinoglossum americanum]|uniref:Uncharacterized protein n=1 Tax=Glutinoglossum americanum TaxID=1670608 RepID=A0A9P8I422_9PEZI|nr:hypothetical protein FGG08_002778 [Glutinoglossum americanum]